MHIKKPLMIVNRVDQNMRNVFEEKSSNSNMTYYEYEYLDQSTCYQLITKLLSNSFNIPMNFDLKLNDSIHTISDNLQKDSDGGGSSWAD